MSISRKRPLATSSKAPVARTKKRSVECTSHSHIVTKTMTNSSLTFEDVQSLIVSMVTRISEVSMFSCCYSDKTMVTFNR